MGLFGKIFSKKGGTWDSGDIWKPLPVPVPPMQQRQLPLGPYKLIRHLGDLQQIRPPRKAQIWQGLDAKDQPCGIAVIEPNEESQKWLKERLGDVKIQKTATFKVQGELRKIGTQLSVTAFDTKVGDRYQILTSVVNDPMQETYEALDTKQDCLVYCTVVVPTKMSTVPTECMKRFKGKGKALHPQILELMQEDLIKPSGIFSPHRAKCSSLYYAITRHVPAVSFAHLMSHWKRKLSAEQIGTILAELGSILQYLTENSMYHGNLRPQTLWIGKEGDATGHIFVNGYSVVDTREHKDTTAFTLLRNIGEYGYPLYMAPEHISHQNVDARGDYFALGTMLHALITGKYLVSATDPKQALRQLSQWNLKGTVEVPPAFTWIQPILTKLLQKAPTGRDIVWNEELQHAQESYTEWLSQGAEELVASHEPEKESAAEEPQEEIAEVEFEDMTSSDSKSQETEPQPAAEIEEWEAAPAKELEPSSANSEASSEKKGLFGRLIGTLKAGVSKKGETSPAKEPADKEAKEPEKEQEPKAQEKQAEKAPEPDTKQEPKAQEKQAEKAEAPKPEADKKQEPKAQEKPADKPKEKAETPKPEPDKKQEPKAQEKSADKPKEKAEAPSSEADKKQEPKAQEKPADKPKEKAEAPKPDKKQEPKAQEKPADKPKEKAPEPSDIAKGPSSKKTAKEASPEPDEASEKDLVSVDQDEFAEVLEGEDKESEEIEDLTDEELLDLAVGNAKDKPSSASSKKVPTAKPPVSKGKVLPKTSTPEPVKAKSAASEKSKPPAGGAMWEEEWEDWEGEKPKEEPKQKEPKETSKSKEAGKSKEAPKPKEAAKAKPQESPESESETKSSGQAKEPSKAKEVPTKASKPKDKELPKAAKPKPQPIIEEAPEHEQKSTEPDDELDMDAEIVPGSTAKEKVIPVAIDVPTPPAASSPLAESYKPSPLSESTEPDPFFAEMNKPQAKKPPEPLISTPPPPPTMPTGTEEMMKGQVSLEIPDVEAELPKIPAPTATDPISLEIPQAIAPHAKAKTEIPPGFAPDADGAWEKEFEMVNSLNEWEEEEEEEDIIAADGAEHTPPPKKHKPTKKPPAK